ncbi:MAG: S4 domain-containing protein, partial [Anaerolineales bacterium]
DVKMNLAHEIVEIFYSDEEADRAQSEFIKVFQQKDIPEEMKEFPFNSDKTVLDVLVETGLVSSKSEGRRLTSQNGVRLDGDVITDANINFPHPGVLQVGKRRFVRVA